MDISPFYELKNRLYASAAAGCGLISEDFRLKRAVENFEPLSKSNKAFGKLYDMCMSLINSESPSSEISDCIALADALSVTQGVYKDNSKTKKAIAAAAAADIPHSELKEFRAKVRKYGEELWKIPKEKAGFLKDPRILRAILDNLEHGKQTLNFMLFIEVLCRIYGDPFADILKASVKDSGNQIKYVQQLRGDRENDWYLSLIENAENSKNVRKEAIAALSCSISNTEKLIELYNTEKGKIKSEALLALARLSPPEAEPIFKKLCGKYKSSNLKYISESHGEECTKFAVKRLTELLEECLAQKDSRMLKKPLDTLLGDLALIMNKTDESADDIIIALCENAKIMLSVYNFTSFLVRINQFLTDGLKGNRAKQSEEQIERLYAKKPEYFQVAKAFLDFIKNPEKKINVSSHTYRLQSLLINIEYMPLLGQYNVGWGPFNSDKLPLLTIGDHFPQSVIDFLDKTSNELLDEFEKLQNGLPNNFKELMQKTGLQKTDLLNTRICSYDVQVIEYYLRGTMFLYNNILTYKNCAAEDFDRIKKAAVPLALRSVRITSIDVFAPTDMYAREIILNYYECSDKELIKMNTEYVLNCLKHNKILYGLVLVQTRSEEVIRAAIDDLERALPTVEDLVEESRMKIFRDQIKTLRQNHASASGS